MLDDKFIGLALAASSSLLIGISFIITKKGLMDASYEERDGSVSAGDTYAYLHNPTWWAGMVTMIFGEIANFAAYSFAPAIMVTPLGALSVLVSASLASWLLQERLGPVGKAGCALCLIGSVMIVLHAPEDKEITSVDEILFYAMKPAFLTYCTFVLVFALYMIYRVAPRYGKYNVLVYISICSLVGSVSVMAVKGFGIALKLTLSGHNQLTHPSTYVFAIIVAVCILTQMNYFNKALDAFSTNIVNPIYYVFFTTATLIASITLFQGFNEASAVDIASLFCGFATIFIGVFLLNSTRLDRRSSTVLSRLSLHHSHSRPHSQSQHLPRHSSLHHHPSAPHSRRSLAHIHSGSLPPSARDSLEEARMMRGGESDAEDDHYHSTLDQDQRGYHGPLLPSYHSRSLPHLHPLPRPSHLTHVMSPSEEDDEDERTDPASPMLPRARGLLSSPGPHPNDHPLFSPFSHEASSSDPWSGSSDHSPSNTFGEFKRADPLFPSSTLPRGPPPASGDPEDIPSPQAVAALARLSSRPSTPSHQNDR